MRRNLRKNCENLCSNSLVHEHYPIFVSFTTSKYLKETDIDDHQRSFELNKEIFVNIFLFETVETGNECLSEFCCL